MQSSHKITSTDPTTGNIAGYRGAFKFHLGGTEEQPSPLITSLPRFLRGDVNEDNNIDITDAIFIINWLFRGENQPQCIEAADINDDQKTDITDVIYLLNHIFQGGTSPAQPYLERGSDYKEDTLLPCDSFFPPVEQPL